jgi:hypothetical protein
MFDLKMFISVSLAFLAAMVIYNFAIKATVEKNALGSLDLGGNGDEL